MPIKTNMIAAIFPSYFPFLWALWQFQWAFTVTKLSQTHTNAHFDLVSLKVLIVSASSEKKGKCVKYQKFIANRESWTGSNEKRRKKTHAFCNIRMKSAMIILWRLLTENKTQNGTKQHAFPEWVWTTTAYLGRKMGRTLCVFFRVLRRFRNDIDCVFFCVSFMCLCRTPKFLYEIIINWIGTTTMSGHYNIFTENKSITSGKLFATCGRQLFDAFVQVFFSFRIFISVCFYSFCYICLCFRFVLCVHWLQLSEWAIQQFFRDSVKGFEMHEWNADGQHNSRKRTKQKETEWATSRNDMTRKRFCHVS